MKKELRLAAVYFVAALLVNYALNLSGWHAAAFWVGTAIYVSESIRFSQSHR